MVRSRIDLLADSNNIARTTRRETSRHWGIWTMSSIVCSNHCRHTKLAWFFPSFRRDKIWPASILLLVSVVILTPITSSRMHLQDRSGSHQMGLGLSGRARLSLWVLTHRWWCFAFHLEHGAMWHTPRMSEVDQWTESQWTLAKIYLDPVQTEGDAEGHRHNLFSQ